MTNKKRILIISIGIILLALLIIGGTYAWLTYAVNVTNGNYFAGTECFNINYDITNDDGTSDITGTLYPSSGPKGGLSGSVALGLDSSCDISATGNIYLNVTNVSSILTQTVAGHCENSQTLETLVGYDESSCSSQTNGTWVTNGTALKYAFYDSTSSNPIKVGYVTGSGRISLHNNFALSYTLNKYYIYVWLDGEISDQTYASQSFAGNIYATAVQGEEGGPPRPLYTEQILNGTDPVLEPGMIPVTISDTGAVTSADMTRSWYSYTNKQWANAVLVNSTVRGTYINEDGTINGNLPIEEDDILAYYVWIPRYKYTFPNANGSPEQISIVFENASTPKSVPASGKASGTDYYTHPAFTFGDIELNGIWVGKFETAHSTLSSSTTYNNLGCTTTNCENANGLIIKPNVRSLKRNSISNMFYASRAMTRTGNPFGLTSETDTHMMKNSEWGAVAYLSHSVYGINAEVGINSNSSYTTGAGNGTTYGTPGTGANTYPQSTTENISGVFDMSGGTYEYVMGMYSEPEEDYSGFGTLPDPKYYDKYTVTLMTSCTLSECGGHALHETKGWYSDAARFVDSGNPWFVRGGYYNNGDDAGSFYAFISDGDANSGSGFRSVAIKGA